MSLTLADARAYLHPFITPLGANDSSVLASINDAQERFILSGKWKGLKATIEFAAPDGFITLPRRYESALGLRLGTVPRDIFNGWHEFITDGPGEVGEDAFNATLVIDQGPGFPTYLDIDDDETATLRVKIEDATDANQTVWLKGLDADGRVVHNATGVEGVSVTTVNPSVTTSQTFSKVTGFQKPVTEGYVTLWKVVDGTETQIGAYEPGETIADYRRYKIGGSCEPEVVTVLCKRKFIPARSESDLIYPGNRGVLKLACQALKLETELSYDLSQEAWANAFNLLNLQSKEARGGAQSRMHISPHGLQLHRIRRMK